MHAKDSYCSHCGAPFPIQAGWPRRCQTCGNSTYRNPLPVAVMLLPVESGLVVVRRNTEPQRGTLTLPGGYIDFGETWQEAGQRELLEETGIDIDARDIRLYDVMNGLDNTLVIFGLGARQPATVYRPFSSAETQEVVLIHQPVELGFTMHSLVVRRYFAELAATP
ncbi:MAG TPA: NUDIX domain-containing protein [Geobacteraceae bacterium]